MCIKKALRQGEVAYNLVSFMWDLPEIRQKALTPATIQSGFLTTGLWPLIAMRNVRAKQRSLLCLRAVRTCPDTETGG
jgi:hypothetical protein